MMMRILCVVAISCLLSACGSAPKHTDNACAIFQQKGGFFNNWEHAAKKAERQYAIPMPVILATIYAESGFRSNARPPRKKLLGVIPGKRPSTAYGYAQALNGTWDEYRKKTGKRTARRTNFSDAADFVGWYHRESVHKNNVAPGDSYQLYLNYYLGHGGYAQGRASGNAIALRGAERAQKMTLQYDQQLRQCGRR